MLPPSHNRAYQDLSTLLTEFESFLVAQGQKNSQSETRLEFQNLTEWFKQNIADLSQEDLDLAIAPRWQSLQTEIKREFKLLSTDILFLSSARQKATQIKRINTISDRLAKLIGYCQIMLNDSN
ncbi:MAG: heterocyst frequency control protein PatD [Waterburya sp.]